MSTSQKITFSIAIVLGVAVYIAANFGLHGLVIALVVSVVIWLLTLRLVRWFIYLATQGVCRLIEKIGDLTSTAGAALAEASSARRHGLTQRAEESQDEKSTTPAEVEEDEQSSELAEEIMSLSQKEASNK